MHKVIAAAVVVAAGLTAGCAGLATAATAPQASAAQNLAKLEKEIQSGRPFSLKGQEYLGAPDILGNVDVGQRGCEKWFQQHDSVAIIWANPRSQWAVQCIKGHWVAPAAIPAVKVGPHR